MKKSIVATVLAAVCAVTLIACTPPTEPSEPPETPVCVNAAVEAVAFDVSTVDNVALYGAQVSDGSGSHDGPLEDGTVVCPYWTLTVGGVDVPVYSTRCALSVHSFAYITVDKQDKDADFSVTAVLRATEQSAVLDAKKQSVTVLPEKRGVTATVADGTVTAAIADFGTYTFSFNRQNKEAVTLYVAEREAYTVPDGWTERRVAAGKHSMADTTFTAADTVYVFEKGRHLVDSISIPSNAWVHLENGAYLEAYPDGEGRYMPVFRSSGTRNVRLTGHGIVDFSADVGGNASKKGAFDFSGIENVTVKGLIGINSNTWTLCFTDCVNVYVEGVMLFGYRTYSDGIMLSDCRDSLVTKCFVRTGDDAMETKSTSASGYTDGVTYRDNDCWTDKGLGYGVVWETNHDVKNVTFIDCSIGFAQSNWDERLGALAIQLGDHDNTVTNIRFENIEIYRSECPAVINCELKQSGMSIDEIYCKDIRCAYGLGPVLRLAEVDLYSQKAKFGTFYLDNVSKNGVTLSEENRRDAGMVRYIGRPYWDPDEMLKINTL